MLFFGFICTIYFIWKVVSKFNRRYKKYHLLWNLFGIVFDEGMKMPRMNGLRLLLISFVLLVILTKMHFFGLFNTSLVVLMKPFVYDSLEAVLHSHLRPMFFKSDPATNFRKYETGQHEILAKVWQKVDDMGIENSLLELDLYSMKQLDLILKHGKGAEFISLERLVDLVSVLYSETVKINP